MGVLKCLISQRTTSFRDRQRSMAAGIKIFKKTQIDTGRVERRDFVFDQVGYKLFQNILATFM